MYMSNIIQPDSGEKTLQPTDAHLSPYRITPCAKAIGALLLVLGSTAAWADDDRRKHSIQQGAEYSTDLNVAQAQYMFQHLNYLAKNMEEVGQKMLAQHMKQEEQRIRISHLPMDQQIDRHIALKLNAPNSELESLKDDREHLQSQFNQLEKQLLNRHPQEYLQLQLQEYQQLPEEEQQHHPRRRQMATHLEHQQSKVKDHIGNNDTLPAETFKASEAPDISATPAKKDNIAETTKSTPPGNIQPAATTITTKPKKATPPAPKPILKSPPLIGHNLQAGSYLANRMAAQQMFIIGDVQHHQGEVPYTDPMTGEQKVTSMWLNTNGAITRFNSAQDQLHTKGTRYATQFGGEISQWHIGEHDLGILGITAGIGKANSRSNSTTSQHHANGSVVGYNLGLYSIWHANNISQLGPYIGLLAQYGMFNNQIKASEVVTGANYKSYIFTSALETGYKIQLIEKDKAKLFVQPQAKVLLQRSSGLQHKELTGPQIKIEEHNTVTTKLGLLTALELGIDTLSTTNTLKIKPFIEANWINSNGNKGLLLDNAHIAPQGINNIAELKLGVEGKFNNNLKLWSHLGQQLGKHNYSDTQAALGINYQF
ncbi:autotransporter outer membrane beta-barrel domain-containing protein [Yersinia intermedia]|uniref:autotransporter outer membrane beta-barrel domain-containing protein n=1 Tax=Yersinia intermedia TaxID=631 RepID=UPI0021BD78DC|nr:autotransporter outer membrane beta-barrel domain-containing protein [Yersinia intermedia]